MSVTSNRVRFESDTVTALAFGQINDKLTGRGIRFTQSAITDFETSIFVNGTLDTALTGVVSATMLVKAKTDLLASPLMSKTVLVADPECDLTTDLTTWNNGTKQQFKFSFTAAETFIALEGQRVANLHVYVYLTLASGDVQACSAPLTLLDSGKGDLGSITVTPAGARMKSNKLQVRDPVSGLYHDVTISTQFGAATTEINPTGEA